jgi:two-component system, sensor histidine kinase and response regulator
MPDRVNIIHPSSVLISVLVVETSSALRATYETLLSSLVDKVHVCANVDEALRLYARHQPDLVITDIEFSGANGFKLIQQLHHFKADLPIIVHSALTDKETLLETINLNVMRYVVKPASRAKLSKVFEETIHDIQFKKQQHLHQQALSNATRNLRRTTFKLLEAAKAGGIGTWYWSFADAQFEWDESMYELYHINEILPFNAIYHHWLNMIVPEERYGVLEAFQQAMRLRERFSYEFMIQLNDTSKKYIRSSAVPYTEDGVLIGMVGSDIDITVTKEREQCLLEAMQQAESASHAKGVFLANMSHEIRTPLNGIIGLTDLTLQSPISVEQRQNLERVLHASKGLLGILNDILDYSKMEAEMMRLEQAPFSIRQMLDDVTHVFNVTAQKKGLNILLELSDSLPDYVLGDVFRLTQVINNLVGNAIKFTEQGRVILSAQWLGNVEDLCLIRFSVSDTGIGISPENQEKIFKAFSQEDASVTRLYGGTGLGLAIAKQLVELMQGHLQINSEPKHGSTFWFDLWLPAANAPKHHLIDLRQVSLNFRCQASILLCEDNPVNQAVAKGYLERYGCKLDIVNNGAEGVELALKNKYDLILMDLQMPVMDGYQAAQIIRRQDSHIPIIALSAAVLPEERARVKQVGMNEHLAKPIDPSSLQKMLARYIEVMVESPMEVDTSHNRTESQPFQYIKLDQLTSLFGTESLVRSLLATFATHYDQVDRLFDVSLTPEQLRRELHALKGAASNLLFVSLQQMAQTLEKTTDERCLREGLVQLKQELIECVNEVKRYQCIL